ncbi:MAG: hypothetical protein ACU85E_01810 [Gammaproteobacteria bacterium]
MKTIRVIALWAGLSAAPAVFADAPSYSAYRDWAGIDLRLQRQQWRIRQGGESGGLTFRELKKLKKQQRKYSKLERHFKRDGRLTRAELAVLHRKLDSMSRDIRLLKHNGRSRRLASRNRWPAYGSIREPAASDWRRQHSELHEYFVWSQGGE